MRNAAREFKGTFLETGCTINWSASQQGFGSDRRIQAEAIARASSCFDQMGGILQELDAGRSAERAFRRGACRRR